MSRQPHFLQPLIRKTAGPRLALYAAESTRVVASELESAFDSATRRRGLLGRSGLAAGHALIIAPCNGVHTFGMQFPIDVIYAARDGRVVKLTPNLVRNRISLAPRAFATIEMAVGSIAQAGLAVGHQLVLAEQDEGPRLSSSATSG